MIAPENENRLSFDVGERDPDETDATEKQKLFVRALLRESGAKDERSVNLDALGKWQASHLINQLIELRDQLNMARTTISTGGAGVESRKERPCPHCAEHILAAAKVCRYCGRDVVPEESDDEKAFRQWLASQVPPVVNPTKDDLAELRKAFDWNRRTK